MTKFVYRSIISAALFMSILTSLAQDSKYYDYAGKFKILFPDKPVSSSQNMTTDMGNVTLYQFIYETSTSALMVSYVDYPADQIANQDNKKLLENAKNGFVGSLKLKISDEGFMTYAKHQGIRFLADNGEMYCSMRDYLVENRLYQLGILQMGAISDQTENDFFDSFELVR